MVKELDGLCCSINRKADQGSNSQQKANQGSSRVAIPQQAKLEPTI